MRRSKLLSALEAKVVYKSSTGAFTDGENNSHLQVPVLPSLQGAGAGISLCKATKVMYKLLSSTQQGPVPHRAPGCDTLR
jgi:hypothetical protein